MKKRKNTASVNNIEASTQSHKCLIITSIFVVGAAIAIYSIYVSVTEIPDLPELDLNEWWGPNNVTKHDTSIRPYRVIFTDAMQEMLRKKFDLYRRRTKTKSLEDNWTYGVNSESFAQYFTYWVFKYNMRERQQYINKFDHFKTNIQGLDIHFVHVKPKVASDVKVIPLLLLHGWPSSIREFYDVIPLLLTKRANYDFVFEIIVPSLPGFVYSDGPVRSGFSLCHAAVVMRNLMHRLGFPHYYIQGGDMGHVIGSHMATLFPNEVLGFHTNFPVNFSLLALRVWIFGAMWPTLIEKQNVDSMYPLKEKIEFYIEEMGYIHLHGTKPDTIGIALQDSPAGLAAYILDRYLILCNPNNKYVPDGGMSKYSMTDLLDNVMLYWTGGRITSSLRLFKDTFNNIDVEKDLSRIPTAVPTWALRLKHEIIYQPYFVLKWKYTNFLGATNLNIGGHFAAFEKPKEFADDVFLAIQYFIDFQR